MLDLNQGGSSQNGKAYLQENYGWAYMHPKGVRVFDRQWLVNLILWGSFGQDGYLDLGPGGARNPHTGERNQRYQDEQAIEADDGGGPAKFGGGGRGKSSRQTAAPNQKALNSTSI